MKSKIILLALIILTSSFHFVKAEDRLIPNEVHFNTGIDGQGDLKVKTSSLDGEDNNIIIAADNTLSITNTTYQTIVVVADIIAFDIIEDIDGDGVKDIVIALNESNRFDNLLVYSGQTGRLLWSKLLSKTVDHKALGTAQEGINIYQIKALINHNIAVISDYQIIVLDSKTGQIDYQVKMNDNIWDIENIDKDTFVITTQLGQVIAINANNGKKRWTKQVTNKFELEMDGKKKEVSLNVWDVLYHNDQLLVTTEDGKLVILNPKNGAIENTIQIQEYNAKFFSHYFVESAFTDSNGDKHIINIGYNSMHFMAYRIYPLSDQQYVVTSYLGTEHNTGKTRADSDFVIQTQISIVDSKEGVIIDQVDIENYALSYSEIVIDKNNDGKDVIVLPTSLTGNGAVKVQLYPCDNLKENTAIESIKMDLYSDRMYLQPYQDGYILQGQGNNTLFISKDFKDMMTDYNTRKTLKLLNKIDDDGYTIGYLESSKIHRVEKYSDQDDSKLLWEFNYQKTDSKTPIEIFKAFKDINNDNIIDYIVIQNENNSTHLLMINGKTADILSDTVIENLYIYEQNFDTVKELYDYNQDGYNEILFNTSILDSTSILDGKDYHFLGEVTVPDFLDKEHKVGDINEDGFDDYIHYLGMDSYGHGYIIGIYTSNIHCDTSGCYGSYELMGGNQEGNPYQKTSNFEIKMVSDINQDGIKDVVISVADAIQLEEPEQYRYEIEYQILSGKDLSLISKLGHGDFYKYGNEYSDLGFDVDGDGYNDFLVKINSIYGNILSGKTNENLANIMLRDLKDIQLPEKDLSNVEFKDVDQHVFFPFVINDLGQQVMQVADQNGDGKKDIMVYLECMNEDLDKSVYLYFFNADLSGEPFKTVSLAIPTYYEDYKDKLANIHGDLAITPIPGSQTKYLLRNSTKCFLIDLEDTSNLTFLNIPVNKYYAIANNAVVIEDEKRNVYYINSDVKLGILNINEQQEISNRFNVKWELPIQVSKNVSIYNNQRLIAKSTTSNATLYLPQGDNELIFMARDQQGIIYSTIRNVSVKKPWFSVGLYIVLSIFSMICLVYLLKLPKLRLKRLARGDGDE